jgi:hypothetical protein
MNSIQQRCIEMFARLFRFRLRLLLAFCAGVALCVAWVANHARYYDHEAEVVASLDRCRVIEVGASTMTVSGTQCVFARRWYAGPSFCRPLIQATGSHCFEHVVALEFHGTIPKATLEKLSGLRYLRWVVCPLNRRDEFLKHFPKCEYLGDSF